MNAFIKIILQDPVPGLVVYGNFLVYLLVF